jgi:hypothetical protein
MDSDQEIIVWSFHASKQTSKRAKSECQDFSKSTGSLSEVNARHVIMSKISKFNQLARRGKSEIRRSKANVEGKPLMKKW